MLAPVGVKYCSSSGSFCFELICCYQGALGLLSRLEAKESDGASRWGWDVFLTASLFDCVSFLTLVYVE